ncbi:MAG TPA: pyridoxal phosphate-dependent aminotransferase [Terriglobales bacterium]|nr:pyridoxal phosphate-dependent aminotransferase [Terriglobales bacterium]
MNYRRTHARSAYMHWARTASSARFSLAGSGMGNLPLSSLRARFDELELTGSSDYGHAPLLQLIAARYGVQADSIVTAAGTSMANHLAMAAVLEPGDEVLVEQPSYGLLLDAAAYLGANIRRFPRRFEDSFRLDPAELERSITPRTRLIVLTNLHNPSGLLAGESELRQIGALAQKVGARVLVDEVYLDMAFERAPRSSFHLGEDFIVTSSLTKAYGLSGLRCGWIFAAPDLVERIWRINDLFAATAPHVSEQLSVAAFKNLDEIAASARALLAANRALLKRFVDSRDDLQTVWPDFGTIVFPRLRHGSVASFCELLRTKYETSVVPGSFFEMPQHFRIGVGGDTKLVEQGLERISAALDEHRRASA